jgi:hypothetical protein
MSSEIQNQEDKTPDVQQQQPAANDAIEVEAAKAYEPGTSCCAHDDKDEAEKNGDDHHAEGSNGSLNIESLFHKAGDAFHNFLEEAQKRVSGGMIPPESARPVGTSREAAAMPVGALHEVKVGKNANQTLREMEDGRLQRVTESKNSDGTTSTVTSVEEYVRDKDGNIVTDKKGVKQTRVLSEDKVSKRDGKEFLHVHTDNKYDANGNLTDAETTVTKDGKEGFQSKFVTKNDYDENGKLKTHHAERQDASGKVTQSVDAKYGYDERGNLTTEDITRVAGRGDVQHEEREHSYKTFADGKDDRVRTSAKIFEKNGKEPIGTLETEYSRDKNGVLQGEHTVERDAEDRQTHVFDAVYGEWGQRLGSQDVHTEYKYDGSTTETVSTYLSEAESSAIKTEYDAEGNETYKTGIIQKMDGSITNLDGKELLTAERGAELGSYWDRETEWNSLERLSGDATNRDVLQGWNTLNRFAATPDEAVQKLGRWGNDDVQRGIDVIEKSWGNGEGRAAQGMATYLSMGYGATAKEVFGHSVAAWGAARNAATHLLEGNLTQALASAESFGASSLKVLKALDENHKQADRLTKMINPDAGVAGEHLTEKGNGCCANGVCELRKDGDVHREHPDDLVPGTADALERGIVENLRWSTNGDFGDALRLQLEVSGGDSLKMGEIKDEMGTRQFINPETGELEFETSRIAGNQQILRLGTAETIDPVTGEVIPGASVEGATNSMTLANGQTVRFSPELAAEQFKRAGVTPEGYDGMVAARNFTEAGVTTAMTPDGKIMLNAEGQPIYLKSAEHGVDAVLTLGQNNPVHGMDAMTELSTRKDAAGQVVSVDMRVGFAELPKIGETLQVTENGTVVPVRDSQVSARTVLSYGAPALDAQGNPVPQVDAQGNPVPKGFVLDAQGKAVPQAVAGAQALTELTRTPAGTDGGQIYTSLQAATVNERAIFEKQVATAVAEGRPVESMTFNAANTTRDALVFMSRTEGQTAGTALEGARMLTQPQTAADGRTYTISPDGTAVGGLNAIRVADNTTNPAEKTVLGGAKEIAAFSAPTEQTFRAGAANTAAMADTTDRTTGQPVAASQMFKQGIENTTSFGRESTFRSGAETVSIIGGGTSNPNAIRDGVTEIRTAADTTTQGSVAQVAQVTRQAGGGDPVIGAQAMMTYNGRETAANGSFSAGAKALYTDLYGSPTLARNAGQTLQPADVQRAVSLATTGTAPERQLQSGMDKTNEIVRASGNTELTGAQVLTNLTNPANVAAFQAVQKAPDAVAAREALVKAGVFETITTPVAITTTTAAATVQKQDAAVVAPAVVAAKDAPVVVAAADRTVAVAAAAERAVVAGTAAERALVASTAAATTVAASTEARRESTVAAAKLSEQVARETAGAAAVQQMVRLQQAATELKATAEAAAVRVAGQLAMANKQELIAATAQIARVVGEAAVLKLAGEKTTAAAVVAAAQTLQARTQAEKVEAARIEFARQAAVTVAAGNKIVNAQGDASVTKLISSTGTINLNVTMLAKQAALGAAAAAADAATRAARVGDAATVKAAAVAGMNGGVVRVNDGGSARAQAIRTAAAGGNVNNGGSANSNRANDLMIGRGFRAVVGGNNVIDQAVKGDLTLKGKKKFRRFSADDRAMLGAEIALAALLISGTVAKERAEQKKVEARKKQQLSAEFAKLSDRLDDAGEISADDNANKALTYKALTRPTWLVRPGEDLVKLAEHLFHEAELGWLIADLNIGTTKESYLDGKRIVELKTRQKIDLPVWQDIVEFHKRNNDNAKPENLITIVTEAAVDTELMNATLGLAMGATVAAPKPLVAAAAAVPAAAEVLPTPAIAGAAPTAKDRQFTLFSAAKSAIEMARSKGKAPSVSITTGNADVVNAAEAGTDAAATEKESELVSSN